MSTQYKCDRCGRVFSKFVIDDEPSVSLFRRKVDLCGLCLNKLEDMNRRFMEADDLLPPLTPTKPEAETL